MKSTVLIFVLVTVVSVAVAKPLDASTTGQACKCACRVTGSANNTAAFSTNVRDSIAAQFRSKNEKISIHAVLISELGATLTNANATAKVLASSIVEGLSSNGVIRTTNVSGQVCECKCSETTSVNNTIAVSTLLLSQGGGNRVNLTAIAVTALVGKGTNDYALAKTGTGSNATVTLSGGFFKSVGTEGIARQLAIKISPNQTDIRGAAAALRFRAKPKGELQ